MKSRKFISLLCAAAMSVSSFAGLAVTASAAGELYTNDGSSNTGWSDTNNVTVATDEETGNTYLQAKARGSSNYESSLDISSATSSISGDYVIEYDVMIHWSNGMNKPGRYNQVAFIDSSAATAKDSRDFAAYGLEITGSSNQDAGGNGYTTGVASSVTGIWQIASAQINASESTPLAASTDTNGIVSDTWYRIQTAVSSGTATIKAVNKANNTVVDTTATGAPAKVDKIFMTAGRGDDSVSGPGTVNIDNIAIYEGAAKTLDGSNLPGEVVVETPVPEPETVAGAAPKLKAPASVTDAKTDDIESATVGTVDSITGDQPEKTAKAIGTAGVLTAIAGNRTDSGNPAPDAGSYVSVVNVTGGSKAIKLAGTRFATGGRTPKVQFVDKEIGGKTAIAAFSVYIPDSAKDKKSRIWLVDDASDINDSASAAAYYKRVYAVLTADEADKAAIADGTWGKFDGTPNRAVAVDTGWHTVVVAVSADAYRVWVDGEQRSYNGEDNRLQADVTGDTLSYGGTASAATTLPTIVIENDNANYTQSKALIDNVLVYKVDAISDNKVLPVLDEGGEEQPSAEAHSVTIAAAQDGTKATVSTEETDSFDAVLIHAKYSGTTLSSVKSYPVTDVKKDGNVTVNMETTDLIANGDKLMVWDSLKGMVPYCAAVTVANSSVQEYSVKVGTITGGSVTASPTKAAKGATVTLTVKADEGYTYKADSLSVKQGTTKVDTTAGGTAGTFTFTMPEGDVDVTAEFTANEYTITVDPAVATAGGTITTTPASKAKKGTEVTVNVTAPQGKVVDKVTYKEEGATDATPIPADATGAYKFEMPAKNVTVSATFKNAGVDVTGSIDEAAHVSGVTLQQAGKDKYTATIEGTSVKFTNVVAGTYDVVAAKAAGWTATVTPAKITVADAALTAAFNITTAADTVPAVAHNIKTTVAPSTTDATVTYKVNNAAATTAKVGETVTVDVAPAAKKQVDKVEVSKVNSGATNVDITSDMSFVMPDEEVTVTVTMKDVPKTPLKNDFKATLKADGEDVTTEGATLQVGQTVTAALEKLEAAGSATAPTGVTYKWYKGTTDDGKEEISGETGASYTVKAGDVGNKIFVEITAPEADETYTGSVTSDTVTVTAAKVTRTVVSSADTQVERWKGDAPYAEAPFDAAVNFGSQATMQVGGTTGTNDWKAMSLVKFTKPADINKEVTKATLRLNIAVIDKGNTAQSRDANVEVHSTGESDWDETKLVYFSDSADLDSLYTANTGAATLVGADSAIGELSDAALGTSINLKGKNVGDWVEYDVTNYVKAYGGDYSFAIISTSGNGAFAFNTKEATTEANRPQLVIEYGDQDSTVTAPKAKHTVTVTAPEGGTLTTDRTKNLRQGDTVTITAKATDAGHKAVPTATGAEALALEKGAGDTWTFEMPDADVTVAATYPRDDIDSIEIKNNDGGEPTTLLAKGEDATYKAVLMNGEQEITLDPTGDASDKVTWTAEAKADNAALNGTSIDANGKLTIGADQEDTVIVVKASVPAKYKEAETKEATIEVTVTTATRYTVEVDEEFAPETAHGQLNVLTTSVLAEGDVYVEVTPDKGYKATAVTYKDTEGGTTYQGNLTVVADEGEHKGQYTFKMGAEGKAKNVTISATFAKEDYAITNSTPLAQQETNNGYITIDKGDTANYEDTVTITATPSAGYALSKVEVKPTTEGSETTINVEGSANEWTFTMPAEPVTVTATFIVKPKADLPVTGAKDGSLITMTDDSSADDKAQTVEDGRKVYKLDASEAAATISTPSIENEELYKTAVAKTLNFQMDFKLSEGTKFTIGNKGTDNGPSLIFEWASDKFTIKHQKASTSFEDIETTGKIQKDKWYRAVLSGVRTSGGKINSYTLNIWEINDEGDPLVLGDPVITNQAVGARNAGNTINNFDVKAETGTMLIDNAHFYLLPTNKATVTVKKSDDGTETGAEDANGEKVTFTKGEMVIDATDTGENGQYTADLEDGTYDIDVAASKTVVAKQAVGGLVMAGAEKNDVTIYVTKQDTTPTELKIFGGAPNNTNDTPHTVFAGSDGDRADYMTLSTKAYNKTGSELSDVAVTWASDQTSIIDIGATDGKVVIKEGAQADQLVTLTATVTGHADVTAKYYMKVVTTGDEIVPSATEDFEGPTNIFGVGTYANAPGATPTVVSWTSANGAKDDLGNLLAIGTNTSQALDISAKPVTPASGETLKVAFTAYNGWSNTQKSEHTVTIANSNGDELFSYQYGVGDKGDYTCKVHDIKIAGVAVEAANIDIDGTSGNATEFNFQSGSADSGKNANGFATDKQWFTKSMAGKVEFAMTDAGAVTVTFNNNATKDNPPKKIVVTGTVSGKTVNLGKLTFATTTAEAVRTLAIDDLLTTLTKSAD